MITEVVVDFKLHVYKELKEKIKEIINWETLEPQLFDQLNILADR
jgi:glutaredoxin-related protein